MEAKEELLSGLKDYNIYKMSVAEYIKYSALAGGFGFIVGYIFYNDVILSILFSFIGVLYPKIKTKDLIAKQKNELMMQFKDMLYYLSVSLSSGKSVENAFIEVNEVLKGIYPSQKTYIIVEINNILSRVQMNQKIESVLEEFSKRSGIEVIKNFSDVFSICRKTGGNLIEVIKNTSDMIKDRIEIQQEINILIAQKKMEQKIISIIPIALILFLSTSSDFIEPVYRLAIGKIVMSIALILIIFGYYISKRIVDIKV